MNLMGNTVTELSNKIKKKEISVREAVSASMNAIYNNKSSINSFITVDEKGAYRKADEIQREINCGALTGALAGVPVAVKDNICTKGILTTCGSKMLSNFTPFYSASAVVNLERAGAVIIGKTNMDEFGMGNTSETSFYGAVKNPWNPMYSAGGSSGGSSAAVAAEECSCALGTDTGGSIRQPASFCGITGIKPTYGTVSRYGLTAYASSMDQIGAMAKNVRDCTVMLEAISSYDSKDSTSVKRVDYNFTMALIDDVKGMKIGIPENCFGAGIEEEVKEAVLKAAKTLEDKGAVVDYFQLDQMKYAVPTYYIIASAEASSNLARFDGVKYGYRAEKYANLHDMYKKSRSEGFGEEVKRRILLGSFVLSSGYYDEYYIKALKTRSLIKQEFDTAFQKYDLILSPTAPTAAPLLGSSKSVLQKYLEDIYTVSVNLAGLPAVSIPFGTSQNGMPLGVQMIANYFCENKIIRAAYALEQSYEYKRCDIAKEKDKYSDN